MLGQQTFCFQKLVDNLPSNVLPLHLKETFPPIVWIFTEGEGIKSRQPEITSRTDKNWLKVDRMVIVATRNHQNICLFLNLVFPLSLMKQLQIPQSTLNCSTCQPIGQIGYLLKNHGKIMFDWPKIIAIYCKDRVFYTGM